MFAVVLAPAEAVDLLAAVVALEVVRAELGLIVFLRLELEKGGIAVEELEVSNYNREILLFTIHVPISW